MLLTRINLDCRLVNGWVVQFPKKCSAHLLLSVSLCHTILVLDKAYSRGLLSSDLSHTIINFLSFSLHIELPLPVVILSI